VDYRAFFCYIVSMPGPSSFIRFATKDEIDAAMRGEAVPRMTRAEMVAVAETIADPSPDNPVWTELGRLTRDIKVDGLMFDD
jgi:hypothetical protein